MIINFVFQWGRLNGIDMVAVKKCKNYEPDKVYGAIREIFEMLGGVEKFVKPGMNVVLKPNLVMAKKPEEAATTHPLIVEAVASRVIEAGGRVTIVDSPGGPFTPAMLKWVYHVTGMEEVAKKTGSTLNYDTARVLVDNPAGKYLKKLEILKPVAEADVLINLPKLKTHGTMVYTGAIKNMFGTIAGVKKTEYHFRMPDYNTFSNILIDIYLSRRPDLNIMDAVIGMEGHGPTGGTPREIGCILASEDGFALDSVCLDLIGVRLSDVPVYLNAMERNLCCDNREVPLSGDSISELKAENFIVPNLKNLKAVSVLERGILRFASGWFKPKPVFRKDICTGCSQCSRNCPAGVIEMVDGYPQADLGRCISCMCCQELCPANAVRTRKKLLPGLFFAKQRAKR